MTKVSKKRQVLRDNQDAIIGYLLIGTDNTARKQAEEALLKAGALQNAIFNSRNFSSIATDANGVIQIFNVGAECMLGYAAAEVMNKITPADISDPLEVVARAKTLSIELATTITPAFEALIFKASRGIEDIYELTYIRKDGSRFPAVVSVTALRDAQEMIIGYLLIGTDNTARKRIEAEQMVLAQRLVELMGGVIGVESKVGVGSVFWFELTPVAAPHCSMAESEAAALSQPLASSVTRIRTVLYVEDNPANLNLVERIIARHPGIKLLTAVTGSSGIEIARASQSDVILMDINLPGITGIEALKILREDKATAHIPVLAMSANAMPRDIAKGMEAGFFRYLTKPIKIDEFMEALEVALDYAQTKGKLETSKPGAAATDAKPQPRTPRKFTLSHAHSPLRVAS